MENIGSSKHSEDISRYMLAQNEAVRAELRPGYRMIESLQISNFRCFREAELHGLGRVNIIVGANASGKTALLESIFLACGASGTNLLSLRAFRGYGSQLQISLEPTLWEELWSDLFFGGDRSRTISVRALSVPDTDSTSFFASFGQLANLSLPIGIQGIPPQPLPPLNLRWEDKNGTHDTTVKFENGQLTLSDARIGVPQIAYMNPVSDLNPQTVNRFSSLSQQKRVGPILDAVKSEFPFISDLRTETSAGNPLICADVPNIPRLIALGAVSSGILKIVNILAAIETHERGVVLIDEIENGIHYERLRWLWRTVLETCLRNNAQVFATTHSAEALKALLPTINGHESDFSLVRVEGSTTGSQLRYFGGSRLEAALNQEIEVR